MPWPTLEELAVLQVEKAVPQADRATHQVPGSDVCCSFPCNRSSANTSFGRRHIYTSGN